MQEVCQGKELVLPESIVEETVNALAIMRENKSPEVLAAIFDTLPQVNQNEIIGIIIDKINKCCAASCGCSESRACANCNLFHSRCVRRHSWVLAMQSTAGSIVCHGQERKLPETALEEAAISLNAMREERPGELEDIFESLPLVDRESCIGVILSKRTCDLPPLGLILSTLEDGVYTIIAVECGGSFNINRGRKSLCCGACRFLYIKCTQRASWKSDHSAADTNSEIDESEVSDEDIEFPTAVANELTLYPSSSTVAGLMEYPEAQVAPAAVKARSDYLSPHSPIALEDGEVPLEEPVLSLQEHEAVGPTTSTHRQLSSHAMIVPLSQDPLASPHIVPPVAGLHTLPATTETELEYDMIVSCDPDRIMETIIIEPEEPDDALTELDDCYGVIAELTPAVIQLAKSKKVPDALLKKLWHIPRHLYRGLINDASGLSAILISDRLGAEFRLVSDNCKASFEPNASTGDIACKSCMQFQRVCGERLRLGPCAGNTASWLSAAFVKRAAQVKSDLETAHSAELKDIWSRMSLIDKYMHAKCVGVVSSSGDASALIGLVLRANHGEARFCLVSTTCTGACATPTEPGVSTSCIPCKEFLDVCKGLEGCKGQLVRGLSSSWLTKAAQLKAQLEVQQSERVIALFTVFNRSQCVGICGTDTDGELCLVLKTADESVFRVVSSQCTSVPVAAPGDDLCCVPCSELPVGNLRWSNSASTSSSAAPPSQHDVPHDNDASRTEIDDSFICHGRDILLLPMLLDEAISNKLHLEQNQPAEFNSYLDRLPPSHRPLCVGVASKASGDRSVFGLLLSTSEESTYTLMSIDCSGSRPIVRAKSCKNCALCYNSYNIRTKRLTKHHCSEPNAENKSELSEELTTDNTAICQGKSIEVQIPQKLLDEARCLASREPELLKTMLDKHSFLSRHYCVGLVPLVSGGVLGMLLVTEDDSRYQLISLKCLGSFSYRDAASCKSCALGFNGYMRRFDQFLGLDGSSGDESWDVESEDAIVPRGVRQQHVSDPENFSTCRGRTLEDKVPRFLLKEAENAKDVLARESPEELNQILAILPRPYRNSFVGIVALSKRGKPKGLLLSTEDASIHSVMSLECTGSKSITHNAKSCTNCRVFLHLYRNKLDNYNEVNGSSNESDDQVGDQDDNQNLWVRTYVPPMLLPQHHPSSPAAAEKSLCNGRDIEIPRKMLDDAIDAKRKMASHQPEELNQALKALSPSSHALCVGILTKRNNGNDVPYGLVLSSVGDRSTELLKYKVVSVDCIGSSSCRYKIISACSNCTKCFHIILTKVKRSVNNVHQPSVRVSHEIVHHTPLEDRTHWEVVPQSPLQLIRRACGGRTVKIPPAYLRWAELFKTRMEAEFPDNLQELLNVLPPSRRSLCVGILTVRRKGTTTDIPRCLVMLVEGAHRIVSVDCSGETPVPNKRTHKIAMSCTNCCNLFGKFLAKFKRASSSDDMMNSGDHELRSSVEVDMETSAPIIEQVAPLYQSATSGHNMQNDCSELSVPKRCLESSTLQGIVIDVSTNRSSNEEVLVGRPQGRSSSPPRLSTTLSAVPSPPAVVTAVIASTGNLIAENNQDSSHTVRLSPPAGAHGTLQAVSTHHSRSRVDDTAIHIQQSTGAHFTPPQRRTTAVTNMSRSAIPPADNVDAGVDVYSVSKKMLLERMYKASTGQGPLLRDGEKELFNFFFPGSQQSRSSLPRAIPSYSSPVPAAVGRGVTSSRQVSGYMESDGAEEERPSKRLRLDRTTDELRAAAEARAAEAGALAILKENMAKKRAENSR